MNVCEAFAALGMAPTDDVDAIRAVHRRLAKQLHPDVQRSAAVVVCDMRVVNRARDVLLEAGQRGSLLVAAAAPSDVRRPASPSTGDQRWQSSPPPPASYPAPGRRWDARSMRASRSRRAAVRWLCVVGGLATATVLLELVPVPRLDQALAPSLSSRDVAVLAAVATNDKHTFDLVFGLLQLMYPVCVVKWCMYAKRAHLADGRRPRGVLPMAMAMVAALVALFWGFTSHVSHGDDLLAGALTPQAYADALAWDHVLMSTKAVAVAVLAALAVFSVARPRAESADPSGA